MKYQVLKSGEFMVWYGRQPQKARAIIDARLDRIQFDGHFGFNRTFEGLLELKWTSGMRIYGFLSRSALEGEQFIILCGGNKNGQNQDIQKAQRIRDEFLRQAPVSVKPGSR